MRSIPSLFSLQKRCSSHTPVRLTQQLSRAPVRITLFLSSTRNSQGGATDEQRAAGTLPLQRFGPSMTTIACNEGGSAPVAGTSSSAATPHLGPPYDQVISSDFLGAGPLSGNRKIYLVVLNYCLPAGLLHVWQLASFRVCADGGCNRLHDELPTMMPPSPADIVAAVAEAEAEADTGLPAGPCPALASICCVPFPTPAHPQSLADGTPIVGVGSGAVNGAHGSDGNGALAGPAVPLQPLANHHHQFPSIKSTGTAAASEAGPPIDTLTLLRLAHMPDVVLGDLDSLRPDIRRFYVGHGVPFLDMSYDQDSNDLAKAIRMIEERFIASDPDPHPDRHQILVLGALGGRLDHTLANLNVLHMFQHLNIALWGDGNLVRLVRPGKALIMPDERFEGPTCGLIPISGPVTATSTGLRWNLADTGLRVGGLVSSSNLLTGAPVQVRCDGPLLWSVEMREEPRPDLGLLWARTQAAAEETRKRDAEAAAAAAAAGGAAAAAAEAAAAGAARPV